MSNDILNSDYKYGFFTDIETEVFPKGLSEEIVQMISAKKEEPQWLLDYRLKAFRHWKNLKHPKWANLTIPEIDYQN
jgi:Fe-S cluster assembly protein SufB